MSTTTHTVDIRARSSGFRVIKAKLDGIGDSANNATRGLYLMQRSLFVLGGAGTLTAMTRQLDALTNYENRLRLTASSAENLEVVQQKLFESANRSRTGYASLSEIYSRTALSVRELGVSQQETLAFTERLSKATIISGASAREAHAALIQLGQGMASNTLRGDELRSILEQLPYVADIISNSLGITRGELREFGTDGKISAEVVLRAFREAGAEIDALFAQTLPTISQSLAILGNKAAQALDQFDDATGFSSSIAQSIIGISDSLDILAVAASLAAVALLGIYADKALAGISRAAAAQIAYSRAVSSGSIVLLNSSTAELQRSRYLLNGATAQAASTSAKLASVTADQAALRSNLALIETQRARAINEVALQQGIAASTGRTTGLIVAQTALNNSTKAMIVTRRALAGTDAAVATAQASAAVATTTLAGAQARLAVASGAASTVTARLAATFPLLTKGVLAASGALRSLFALMLTNPLTVAIIAITGAVFALRNLRDASQTVNAVVQKTDVLMRSVGEAFSVAEREGKTLAETFNSVTEAQMRLQKTEAIDAQRAAIAALSDQLVGFNATWTDLKTALSFDRGFAAAANQVNALVTELAAGQVSLIDFKDRLASLAVEADNARFTEFTRGILDAVNEVETAQEQVQLLDAIIAEMNGTATASQSALLRMASGIDSVASSASGAASAISYFIGQIPALKQAQETASTLQEASGILTAGMADLEAQQKSGALTTSELISEQTNLNNLYRQAVSEIDGSAEATRDANEELERYNNQADLASRTGLDRTIASATQSYEALRNTLVKAGASTEQLAQAEANYQQIVAGAQRDAAEKGVSSKDPNFNALITGMEKELELLRLGSEERSRQQGLIELETELKRKLTDQEVDMATALLNSLRAAETQSEVLQGIIGPREEIISQQEALNSLFEQGAIGMADYTLAIREMQTAADEASGTLAGGFRSSISGAIMSAQELGSALGDIVVGAADRAADAIVEFAKTGKFNMKSFFADLFADITKLIAKQLILKALGFAFGVPISGATGGGGGLGFSSGGSILPTGPGSTDSQVVSFAKRPDERVDILTPGQQNAQKHGKGESTTTVVQSPPVNIAAVLSPSDIIGSFDNDEGETMIINILQKNSSKVKSVLGG